MSNQKIFQKLSFKFNWRPYQINVLKEFNKHISDNQIHIIAPPGSGKTILGIEMIKRISKRTLVLAPTLTIRNQWNERLQTFFTIDKFKDISFDIKTPSDITFSTYQGLHAFFKSFSDKEDFFNFFKNNAIDVILLDEAHHLKNEWWKCLYELKKELNQTIIALTATPPYDSDTRELEKYFMLCGEIDNEISVPQLVKEKNLCPHQDLVYLSIPEKSEMDDIFDFRFKVMRFYDDILNNQNFISFLKNHRFYHDTMNSIDDIYKFPDFFSALFIFLNESKELVPKEKLRVLGFNENEKIEFPKLDNNWLEILFQHILITDRKNLTVHETFLNDLESSLKKLGVFHKNKVDFTGNFTIYNHLRKSPTKLCSIEEIVIKEENNLQENLRCVILTDYIKKEYLNIKEKNVSEIKEIGVIPIFHKLKNKIRFKKNIAVLSGSLTIIHQYLIPIIETTETTNKYIFTNITSLPEYFIITTKNNSTKSIVTLITQLFELGHIKILIGTKSLLGEGWDAPSINSLILASFVGSFVTSNQMRGRAIRIDNNSPNKVGIIWHLATIDLSSKNNGSDFNILSKRFDAFLGINNSKNTEITSGIERLSLPKRITKENTKVINSNSFSISENRDDIRLYWKNSIDKGNGISKEIIVKHTDNKRFLNQKKTYYKDIVKYSIIEIFIGLSFFIPEFIIKNIFTVPSKGFIYFLYIFFSGLFLNFGFKIYNSILLYSKYGLIHKKIKKMAETIIETMSELKILTTPKNDIDIKVTLLERGNVMCTISNASRLDTTIFSDALNQLLSPIENPKYLLIKTNKLKSILRFEKYFPIPKLFDNNKKTALIFLKHWNRKVGKFTMLYTRNYNGRKTLLKARLFSIQDTDKNRIRNHIIWK